MDRLRSVFDEFYDLVKPGIFIATSKNPERAHWLFTTFCRGLELFGLDKVVLENRANKKQPPWEISNAAGFNKNGELSPRIMKSLGFNRTVVGTVSADNWEGNPKPRIKRFPRTKTLVNWMGLPGIGAERVAEKLYSQQREKIEIPITINVMSTPEKSGVALLKDLEKTVLKLSCVPYVDRFELNISCPNTYNNNRKIDSRAEYQSGLGRMLDAVGEKMHSYQDLYVKVSPDLYETDVDEIVKICNSHNVKGFTIANTTTKHKFRYIPDSPGKGGASGDAVYKESLRVQKLFAERTDAKLIACGGINSRGRAFERCAIGNTSEIQLFTPLIFEGPKLLYELKNV